MTTSLLCLAVVLGVGVAANGQQPPDLFDSHSDGSDGDLDLSNDHGTVVFIPSNYGGDQHALNIFNWKTITIPKDVTLKIDTANLDPNVYGPVYFLAQGDVDIEGTIDLSGQPGLPPSNDLNGRRRSTDAGAGGFDGGIGGRNDGMNNPNEPLPLPGDGPGGGAAGYQGNGCTWGGAGGRFSGNNLLVPLVGGSGGGGGIYIKATPPYGASGGAGGGALLIAGSTTITVNGTITANGGNGGTPGGGGGYCFFNDSQGYGGGGSGGGIRLVANTITGSGVLTVAGGQGFGYQDGSHVNNGGLGVIRFEAFTETFSGKTTGTVSIGTPYYGFLGLPTTPPPTIVVTMVDNNQVANPPKGSLINPDVTIDNSSQVMVMVQAAYIPLGTKLTLNVFSENGTNGTNQTVQTTPLSGTLEQSTATAMLTFPSGYSLNYMKATWQTMNQMLKRRQ